MIKLYLSIFLLLFYFSSSKAGTWYSGPAGNWCSQPDGKGQCVDNPKEQDYLIIDRAVTLKGPYNPKGNIKIVDGGILTISNSQSGDMQLHGELQVDKGGILVLERNLSLKSKSKVKVAQGGSILVSGKFSNQNNSKDVEIEGKLEVGGDFENGKNGEISGGGQIAIAGSCSNSGKLFGVSNTCSGIKNLTLPVELLFFEAQAVGNEVHLKWATASEENFDFFVVEKSVDAIDFVPTGEKIHGAGNSTKISNYSYIDEVPFSGRSYYRLKAVDYDGTVEYHPVTSVDFAGNSNVKMYPNPSNGHSINLSISSNISRNSLVKIYNIIGEEVFKAKFINGNNEYNFNKPLKKGLYIVMVEDGYTKRQMKLTIQ
ncbi:MAG: T9SS type A sorting domain-containing protein [Bacteroidota bacterium]|nr:T9SS type A sorting domain-containing protein [Bacteroidota bacterium]